MIGRLVEDEQVYWLQQEFEYGQTSTLASREHLDLLGGFLTTEHEGSQQVAYLVAYFSLGHIIDGLEDCQLAVKQRGLVLGEVANLHVVAQLQLAFIL